MKRLLFVLLASFSSFSFANALPQEPHLYVQGTAKLQVKPDRATITIGIDDTQSTIAEAKKNIDDIAQKVIAIGKQFGIAEKDIQAQQLNAYKQMDYDREQNKQVFVGFRVSRDIQLTLSQIEQYPELLQALVDAGVTEFRNTQFTVSDQNTILDAVQKAAIKDAKLAAKELAKDFDVKLGSLYSVSFSPLEPQSVPYMRANEKMMVMADGGNGPAYNTGHITIDAQVYAVYLID
jgi:hypothetical protein